MFLDEVSNGEFILFEKEENVGAGLFAIKFNDLYFVIGDYDENSRCRKYYGRFDNPYHSDTRNRNNYGSNQYDESNLCSFLDLMHLSNHVGGSWSNYQQLWDRMRLHVVKQKIDIYPTLGKKRNGTRTLKVCCRIPTYEEMCGIRNHIKNTLNYVDTEYIMPSGWVMNETKYDYKCGKVQPYFRYSGEYSFNKLYYDPALRQNAVIPVLNIDGDSLEVYKIDDEFGMGLRYSETYKISYTAKAKMHRVVL